MQSKTHNSARWIAVATVPLFIITLVGSGFNRLSAAPADGADTFKTKCGVCHGPDASGSTPMGQKMKIRDLRSPDVQKQSDDELAGIITNGKPPMPAYGKTLAAKDIRQLVAYLRSIATKS